MKTNASIKKRPSAIRQLLADYGKLKGFILLEIIGALSVIACNAISPQLLGNIVGKISDFVLRGKGDKETFFASLRAPMVALIAVYAAYAVCSWGKTFLHNYTMTKKFTCGLRIRMSEKIGKLPVSYVDKTPTGEILSRARQILRDSDN